MIRLLATLLGTVVAPLLVLLVSLVFYEGPAYDSWELAPPLLTLASMAASAVVGAISGFAASGLFLAGRTQPAWLELAASGAVVLAMPAYVLTRPHRRRPRPANEPARARWARRLTAHVRREDERTWEEMGLSLAARLRRVIGEPMSAPLADSIVAYDGHELRQSWNGTDPAALAALGAYTPHDLGWRWEVASESPPRVIVVPDRLLDVAGPVFDIWPDRILRRADRDAPGYAVDRVLPLVAAARRCLLAAAEEAEREGRWDGTVAGLRPLFAPARARAGDCPRTWYGGVAGHDGSWSFRMSSGGALGRSVVEVEVQPAAGGGGAPFVLAFTWMGAAYVVDADGALHVRDVTAATPPTAP